jgi:VIT1/CCC1 family predicted Fe2+/Mn2+ transporter
MSHENSSGADETGYWHGRYEEAKTAREELYELTKLLIAQAQALQVQLQQQQLVARPPPSSFQSQAPAPSANSVAGRPITVSMSGVLGVLPPLLMFIFGLYGTTTGADIGTTMIIIGAIFAILFTFYLLTRDRRAPQAAGVLPSNPPAASSTTAEP